MGYSPGDFVVRVEGKDCFVHWEVKQDSIVLWYATEMAYVLRLDRKNAAIAAEQLSLLAEILEHGHT